MIYVVGDSHAQETFKGVRGVSVHHLGPVTMKRIGHPEDTLLPDWAARRHFKPSDIVIFCFGEIDMRCYVKLALEHRKESSPDALLEEWATRYANAIAALNLGGTRVSIMSIVPPSTKTQAESTDWPVGGTDQERVLYTRTLNGFLAAECGKRGWVYLDVYSLYATKTGLMPKPKGPSRSVHIKNTAPMRRLMRTEKWAKL
ncbi:MAG: hypothetical protein IMZ46_02235 [Acidobacteria bacterium]|nr:hypothetical protein [Acidobacteriota bacterium]